jgi:DNA invertase Pin-like site-specific DNA recombinase
VTLVRCAIYTRKSSEEGLEQSFNSLDAQREACEAYIASQKALGWKALPALYDDGGYSGGSMDRPALTRLLDDIRARHVDNVVVYKVDRLTRSLADFARIVDVFDSHGVSFVSVTQAFNTTSSMGRLTLNVLLSFAQFEREVTGERIRDKIAASKAKGMWMGGYPPLGYDAKNRTLVIVRPEADAVRHIFDRYLALGSVRALAIELDAAGIRSKAHSFASGEVRGGTPFSRGALFHLLKNRIYVGEIVHKQQSYPGQHVPIIPREIFDRVQEQLAEKPVRRGTADGSRAPLSGLVCDAAGARMTPVHAYGRSGRRYRYYVSAAPASETHVDHVSRVAASVLEELVLERSRALVGLQTAEWPEILQRLRKVIVRGASVSLRIKDGAALGSDWMAGEIDRQLLAGGELEVEVAACMQPRKGSTRVSAPAARLPRAYHDRPLIAALKRAHRELAIHGIACGSPSANARGMADPYLRRITRLAFLAPDIQHAILTGRQPPGVTLKRLTRVELPLDWEAQRKQLAFD